MKKYFILLCLLLSCRYATAQIFVVDTLIYNGNPNNRINLLILGDGYTSAQMGLFRTNALAVGNYLLNTPPFNQYKPFFNVFAIEVVSNQSGNDHPGNSSDSACGTQPVVSVDNYLKSSFDGGPSGGGVHRCIYSNQLGLIYSISNTNFPQWDYINVLANTPYYGGCAGGVTFTSTHTSSSEIFVHEFGHSFGGLTDEYDYGSSNCTVGTTQRINVSQQTDTSLLVWRKWLTTAPIPTPNGTNCSLIGLYQGAATCATNWYRPKCNCKMRALNQPFCEVCKEQLIYKVSVLVNPIEGYSPQNLSPQICRNTPQLFTTTILNSLNNTVRTQWFVDNVLVRNNSLNFTFDPALYADGAHTIKAVAYDTTSMAKKTLISHNVTWNINLAPLLEVNTSQTNVTCNGGNNGTATAITTGGNTPYTYNWSSGGTGATTTNLAAGTYMVIVTSNGTTCTDTASVTITEPVLLTASISANGSTEICQGDSVTLTSDTAHTYLWNNGGTTQSITVTDSGNYFVTINDVNGCSATSAAIHVVVHPLPATGITSDHATTFCLGDSVILTSVAASSYVWNNNETTQSITVLNAGTYFVKITDVNGCSATSAPVNTVVETFPVAIISANGPTTFCSGDSVLLSASGNGSYVWSTSDATSSIIVHDAGDYFLAVANSCGTDTATITVTVNGLPISSVTPDGSTTFCAGDSVTLTANSANAYEWSSGAVTQSITVSTNGNYFVTIKDANGCEATSPAITVLVHAPQNGSSIILNNDTLISPYTQNHWYIEGNPNLLGIGLTYTCGEAGNYFVTGNDANGCAATSDTLFVNCSTTGIQTHTNETGIQLYPNPTGGNTTISYMLLNQATVSIELYDAIGNRVQTILEKETQRGNNSYVIETSRLANGIYFMTVTIDNIPVNIKLAIIKNRQ